MITILDIFPYCPKYSFERSVGMSYKQVSSISDRVENRAHTSSLANLGPSPTT